MKVGNTYIKIILVVVALIILNVIGNSFYKRYDLTKGKRYTLSNATKEIVNKIDEPLTIKVYLQGDFPTEFKRIQLETNQFLEELNALNDNIKFRFVNPVGNTKELLKKVCNPAN